MSAPEVGDRVRVIAGAWRGWSGHVVYVIDGNATIELLGPDRHGSMFRRALPIAEVEKVPTTPTDGHRGDKTGADVGLDPEVGDRVRVIAGQWTGWEGVVIDRYKSPSGRHWRIVEYRTQGGHIFTRPFRRGQVEVIEP